MNDHGAPLVSARNLQQVIIQSTMLYGAALTWNGQKGWAEECQKITNTMARNNRQAEVNANGLSLDGGRTSAC